MPAAAAAAAAAQAAAQPQGWHSREHADTGQAGADDASTYVLIGSPHSLYTAKLRAYLLLRQLPHEELTASADAYRRFVLRTGVAFIPVLVLPDQTTVLQDSHAIIRHLEAQLQAPQPLLPATPRRALAAQLLELYADEWLLLPAMHYRWSFPEQRERLLYQFGSTNVPTAPYDVQMAAGAKVASRFAAMLPGLGITPDSIPVIERRFRWQLAVLEEHLKRHAFLLGSLHPSCADVGFMGPLAGHLCTDPVPGCLLRCAAPLVADFVERLGGGDLAHNPRARDRLLQHAGGSSASTSMASSAPQEAGPQQQQSAHQLVLQQQRLAVQQQQQQGTSDTVPPMALLLLHHMFLEQVPAMRSTLQLLKAWMLKQQQEAEANSSHGGGRWAVVPRFLGRHGVRLYDPESGQACEPASGRGPLQCAAAPYTAWRAAEIVAWYRQLPAGDKAAVHQLLLDISAAGSSAPCDSVAATAGRSSSSAASSCGAALPAAVGNVDAVGEFASLVELVAECGRLQRRDNRVVVWLDGRDVHSKL